MKIKLHTAAARIANTDQFASEKIELVDAGQSVAITMHPDDYALMPAPFAARVTILTSTSSDAPCSGKGYQLTDSPLALTLFFAILDDDGKDAGVGIKMSLEDMKNPLSLEEIDNLVSEGEREGFQGYPIRAVTPEEYKAAQYK